MLVLAVILLPPFLSGVLTRLAMFSFVARRRACLREAAVMSLPGTCRDLLVPASLLLIARTGFFQEGAALFLSALAAGLAWLFILLSIVDAFVFYQTRQRICPIFIRELSPRNALTALSGRQLLLLAGLGLLLCFQLAAVVLLSAVPQDGLRSASAVAAALLLISLLARGKIASRARANPGGDGAGPVTLVLIDDKLRLIRSSCLGSLWRCLRALRANRATPARPEEYTSGEERCLSRFQLIGRPRYSGRFSGAPRYRRVILVCLESVSRRMLPFYNPDLPPAVMPFMQSLLTHCPRLDRLQTANWPTEQGLYALHASRLSYEYDLQKGLGRIESLSSLLREQGFSTWALSGVTRHFGNKDIFFKRLLRYEHFLAEEDIRRRPGAIRCGWGVADRTLYDRALDILLERKNEPVLLTVETANTHPPFYYSLAEERFPPLIRETDSRLLRSLHEADADLLFFFQALNQRGLFDKESILIITADHSPNHGNEYLRLFDLESFKPEGISMVFVTPDAANNPFRLIKSDTACSQLDLLPTFVEALGLRRVESILGRSLFCGGERPVISKNQGEMLLEKDGVSLTVPLAGGEAGDRLGAFRKWYYNSLACPYVDKSAGLVQKKR